MLRQRLPLPSVDHTTKGSVLPSMNRAAGASLTAAVALNNARTQENLGSRSFSIDEQIDGRAAVKSLKM